MLVLHPFPVRPQPSDFGFSKYSKERSSSARTQCGYEYRSLYDLL